MVVQRSMHPAIHGRESLTTRCVRFADANFEDQYIGPMMRIIGNTPRAGPREGILEGVRVDELG